LQINLSLNQYHHRHATCQAADTLKQVEVRYTCVPCRMPLGGPGGLQVTLDQATFDSLSADLFRRARLPLDQACWTAGVDLNELQMTYTAKKEEMARKGVAKWKQDMVGAGSSRSVLCKLKVVQAGLGFKQWGCTADTIDQSKASHQQQARCLRYTAVQFSAAVLLQNQLRADMYVTAAPSTCPCCFVFPPVSLQLKLEIRPRARAAVSKVLLVGGATRMPAVQRFISNMTGLTPVGADGGVDPDEAVALGAAVQVRIWCGCGGGIVGSTFSAVACRCDGIMI
jgi:hypothetical protein